MSKYISDKHLERERFVYIKKRTGFKVQNEAFLECGKYDCQKCNKSNDKIKTVEYTIPGENNRLYHGARV